LRLPEVHEAATLQKNVTVTRSATRMRNTAAAGPAVLQPRSRYPMTWPSCRAGGSAEGGGRGGGSKCTAAACSSAAHVGLAVQLTWHAQRAFASRRRVELPSHRWRRTSRPGRASQLYRQVQGPPSVALRVEGARGGAAMQRSDRARWCEVNHAASWHLPTAYESRWLLVRCQRTVGAPPAAAPPRHPLPAWPHSRLSDIAAARPPFGSAPDFAARTDSTRRDSEHDPPAAHLQAGEGTT